MELNMEQTTGDHRVRQNKTDSERQISHAFFYYTESRFQGQKDMNRKGWFMKKRGNRVVWRGGLDRLLGGV